MSLRANPSPRPKPAPPPGAGAAARGPLAMEMAMLRAVGAAALRVVLTIEAQITGGAPEPASSPVEGAAASPVEDSAPSHAEEPVEAPAAGPVAGAESDDAVLPAFDPSKAPPLTPRALADLTLAFSRAARALRLTVFLQSQLVGEAEAKAAAEDPPMRKHLVVEFVDPATRRLYPTVDALQAAQQARKEAERLNPPPQLSDIVPILRQVARGSLQTGELSPRETTDLVERLTREGIERLGEEREFEAIMRRPVSEIIEMICRDLGLSPDWPRIAEEAWARGELESDAIGKPLAEFAPPRTTPDDPDDSDDPHDELVDGAGSDPPRRPKPH